MVVTDSYENEYDRWTTDGSNHIISGLIEGEYYTLTESTTPEGYEPAEPITFTYQNGSVYIVTYDDTDGSKKLDLVSDQTIVMLDNKQDVTTITTEPVIQNFDVCINKIDDQDQTSLAGAQLQVTAADGTFVEGWISDGTQHWILGLSENVRYTLTELNAPEGYELADPIDFIIQNGKVYRFVIDESGASEKEEDTEVTIVMVDKKSTETTTTITTEETTTTTATKNRVDQDDQNVTTTTTVKVATGNKTNNQNQSSSSSSGNRTSGTTNVRTASSPKTGDSMLPVVLTANAALLFAVCCKAKKRKK